MKQVLVSQYGNADVLQLVEKDIPEPAPNEVCIKINAAGVSLGDISMRAGLHNGKLPFVPGFDVTGEIDAVGKDVTSFKIGQQVAALSLENGYAEYICLNAELVVPIPDGLDPTEAVSLVSNYLTAYQMLHRIMKAKPNQKILIHGAAGGIGTALLQLGSLSELEMFGTASTPKHNLVRKLGGIPIDYRNEDFVSRINSLTQAEGVDGVFDPIAGKHWWQSYHTLNRHGHFIGYGLMNLDNNPRFKVLRTGISLSPLLLMKALPNGRSATFFAIELLRKRPEWHQRYREDLTTLFDLLKERKIQPVIAERLPLAEASKAHQLLENGGVSGKIVLVP